MPSTVTIIQCYALTVTIIQCYAPTVTIIQCYAPTNDHNDEDKDKFYNQLQSLINKTPSHDLLLVTGDFNTKIGNDNIGVERTIGTHGIGQLNQNGERLLELCQVSDLCISNITFQHKDIHKVTWNSPDYRTKNQIDHICINNKYRSFIQDVRAYRGADIGSDHNLCIAKLKAKLKCKKTNKLFRRSTRKD